MKKAQEVIFLGIRTHFRLLLQIYGHKLGILTIESIQLFTSNTSPIREIFSYFTKYEDKISHLSQLWEEILSLAELARLLIFHNNLSVRDGGSVINLILLAVLCFHTFIIAWNHNIISIIRLCSTTESPNNRVKARFECGLI